MSKRVFTEDNYRALGEELRRQILMEYGVASCIATCAATADTLKQLHVDAYPLAVTAVVVNDPLYKRSLELGFYPSIESPDYPEGGYGIMIGDPNIEVPGGWSGHLVVVADRKYILDFSLDQANRPEHGIQVGVLCVPVTEPFLRGRAHLTYRYGDTYIHYKAYPKDKSFRDRPNWSGETRPTISIAFDKSTART